MKLAAGARLGPYEIRSLLGAGGMGEVYRARDTRLGRDVAVKILPPSYSADSDRLRRFEQEARAASVLSHPNILAIVWRDDRAVRNESRSPKWLERIGRSRGPFGPQNKIAVPNLLEISRDGGDFRSTWN